MGRASVRRKRECFVASECIGHSCVCEHGGASCEKLDQDSEEPHDHAAGLSACVEEDLCCWEAGGGVEDGFKIVQAKA